MNTQDHLNTVATQMRANSERWFPQLHDGSVNLSVFYALGLSGEVGEVANVVKKWQRGYEGLPQPIGDELADVFTYLLLLADECGVDLMDEYTKKVQINEERWGSSAPVTD